MPVTRRLRLHAIQAAFGDCLVIEARSAGQARHILIDGGPTGTYAQHLRPALTRIAADGGTIDLAVLSHIDNDHVAGLLDLLDEMRDPSRATSAAQLPRIRHLWHNSFSQAVGSAELEPAVRRALAETGRAGIVMPALSAVMRGVEEGDKLRASAKALGLPVNDGFPGGRVLVGGRELKLDDLVVQVVGPSQAILEKLRKVWLEWLARHRPRGIAGEGPLSVAADRSVPNLSSIAMLLLLDGRSLLLTGDARGDQILEGMREAGLLDRNGRRHVSVLKMPHHGSSRNADRKFLEAVTADIYVFSADGRYGNPDHECLTNVVEVAREAGRSIELAMTNKTPSGDRLAKTHPAKRFGYTVRMLPPDESVLTIDVPSARRSAE
jgi:beta-lactamase superfamily II metal-dependent hydrolase